MLWRILLSLTLPFKLVWKVLDYFFRPRPKLEQAEARIVKLEETINILLEREQQYLRVAADLCCSHSVCDERGTLIQTQPAFVDYVRRQQVIDETLGKTWPGLP